jgi:carboxyl-terminal processing protease
VIDLRGNAGGGFDSIVESVGYFLPKGTTVARVKRHDGKTESFVTHEEPLAGALPLAVLVDHDTSCGAELLSEALREERHAQLVGTGTLGKWSMQTVEDLPNGYAIKFTVGLFESPQGKNFDGVGLSPDVEVALGETEIRWLDAMTDMRKRLAADAPLRAAVSLVKSHS